jgi:hypothetical protein
MVVGYIVRDHDETITCCESLILRGVFTSVMGEA